MKRRLLHTLAVLTVVLPGTAMMATTPASASDMSGTVCILNQNTWLRTQPYGHVLRTLSAGRGFRIHVAQTYPEKWYYGHGAQAPEEDGWIPASNCQ